MALGKYLRKSLKEVPGCEGKNTGGNVKPLN